MKFFACLLLLAAAIAPGMAALTRGPYLQDSTPGSIVIRWRTSTAESSRVIYGTNPATCDLTNNIDAGVTEHIVTLTNLSADTKYFYSIGASNTTLAGPGANHFFLTHPLSGTPKPLRVWIIGDAGTKDASQVAVRNAFETFNGTNTLHAWLQLGDNAYDSGYDSEYQSAVFNIYTNELRNSVTWPTLGNHETVQSTAYVDTYPYFSIFTLPTAGEAGGVASGTEHYYSFDLGMVHFICLDSMTADRATNGAMATWLRSDLAVTTSRWLIAFWHHPPYSKGSHDSDPGGSGYDVQMGEMRANFLPILENGGVDLVFSGHSHAYERSKLLNGHYGISTTFNAATNVVQTGSGRETNGVGAYHKPDGLGEHPVGNRGTIYTVAGSSGKVSGGTVNHPAMFYSALTLGSVVLDFNTNRLDAIFLRETGATNDSFTIIKDGTCPPRLTDLTPLTNGDFQFTVLTRGYRTNIIEASTCLAVTGAWQPVGTNTTTNAFFSFTHTNALTNASQFYRVRRP
ncbi:MAG: metallophosphoesterase family protein [Verrucomicrobiales bacterium]|nr:metallophosphoesterase family protein [Verrucomicrobiales bacterium]